MIGSARLSTLARVAVALGIVALTSVVVIWAATVTALLPMPAGFADITAHVTRMQVTDRNGRALNTTYANDWNLHDTMAIHQLPELLVSAFVQAEDQRFFEHGGQDWLARLSAAGENLMSWRAVRGASTVTEQVVRMIHERPRTLWSRWLEGWEARRLEHAHSKLDILEFYLNQVPYASNRRGVVQAARHYFDRDLKTLSTAEMLALAVLVRAPSRLDLFSGDRRALERGIDRLAARMQTMGLLTERDVRFVDADRFDLQRPALQVDARHFLNYVTGRGALPGRRLRTTLDGALQARLQPLLDQRLAMLAVNKVTNAGLLVADHQTGEVLAWLIGGAGDDEVPGRLVDAVTTPRQPGSAQKPFLYALALQRGWTAATLIDDSPLTEMVGFGLHSYSNYSRTFYGPVTLRTALGNSLNIPAVRTVQFTGPKNYLRFLERLGFQTLSRHPDHYGDGLALGNGEVTLLELVEGYAALANRGVYRQLALRMDDVGGRPRERVMSAEIASLIGNMLSDPNARALEFGSASLLNLPHQVAIKTGTSSDYRDSWAVGFDDRFVVGVWMGNLDQTPTLGVTGSTGPALVLRGAFDILSRHRDTRPLWLSPRLERRTICADTGIGFTPGMDCPQRSEYFRPGSGPVQGSVLSKAEPGRLDRGTTTSTIRLRQPTPGLHMAYDPRLPADDQAFEFVIQGVAATDRVRWSIDDQERPMRSGGRYLWPLVRGDHSVSASVWRDGTKVASLARVEFLVK